ncbi:MAG: transcriptional repressor [Syntrophobacteraceae bacterium]|nr:transcriptional repressor [Syntrophobacteraceae bacterium]
MEPVKKRQEMEQALRMAGYRITGQRKAIVDYLVSTPEHPAAYKIFEEVRKVQPRLSLATVYNTLHVLTTNGLIKMLTLREDNRYEANLSFHINLICLSCGGIEDLEAGTHMSPEEVREKIGFEVKTYRMEYHGLCSECKARADQKEEDKTPSGGRIESMKRTSGRADRG